MCLLSKIAIFVQILLVGVAAQFAFSGGMGTESSPFEISSPAELDSMHSWVGSDYRGVYFILKNDMDMAEYLSGSSWTPIGSYTNDTTYQAFYGNFDGDNYKIQNLSVKSAAVNGGLFGYCIGSRLNRIILDSISIIAGKNTGGLCGILDSCTIDSCTVSGRVSGSSRVGGVCGTTRFLRKMHAVASACTVSASGGYCGGLVGMNLETDVTNSSATGIVTSSQEHTGGFIGNNNASTIKNCSVVAVVRGESKVGGFVGENVNGKILNSTAKTTVNGLKYVGGFVGGSYYSDPKRNGFSPIISSCTSDATVMGDTGQSSAVGGFAGTSFGLITNCSSIGTVTGRFMVGGFCGDNNDTIIGSTFRGDVLGMRYTGGCIGNSSGKLIDSCSSSGTVKCLKANDADLDIFGGFVGYNYTSNIRNSSTDATVNGGSMVGGFAGINDDTIFRCFSTGSVFGKKTVGGFAGRTGKLTAECFASGSVKGTDWVGGFAGDCRNTKNCYATGGVSGGSNFTGGFCGYNNNRTTDSMVYAIGTVNPAYTTVHSETAGQTRSHFLEQSSYCNSIPLGLRHSFAEMGKKATYEGWNFDSVWSLDEDKTFPYLKWQQQPDSINFLPGITEKRKSILEHDVSEMEVGEVTILGDNCVLPRGRFTITLFALNGKTLSQRMVDGPTVVPIVKSLPYSKRIIVVSVKGDKKTWNFKFHRKLGVD